MKYIYKCNGKKCEKCKNCGYTADEKFRADGEVYGAFYDSAK